MPSVEINLIELATYIESRGGDVHEGLTEWGQSRGLTAEHLKYVWDQFGANNNLETFIGLCHDASSISIRLAEREILDNAWLIPDSYDSANPNKPYSKFLVSRPNLYDCEYVHATDGDMLTPAPSNLKPEKTIQHGWHFLVGAKSALPSVCGQIEEYPELTAIQYLEMIESSKSSKLLSGIGTREICFFLDRVANLQTGKLGAASIREITGVSKSKTELAVSKFFARRRVG